MRMRILFVCTGNTCRSPMAEGLFRRLARESELDVDVRSAGVAAIPGADFADNAVTVLKEREALFEGSAMAVSPEIMAWADIVLVMTAQHKQSLSARFTEHAGKIHLLKEYVNENERERRQSQNADRPKENGEAPASNDITDPVGGTLDDYRHCADELESLLRRLVARLKAQGT